MMGTKNKPSRAAHNRNYAPQLANAPPRGDAKLVQIVDAAFADAAQRSGNHLKCRPGCTQCCIGVFAISQLDAARLRAGMRDLEAHDSDRARNVRDRAEYSVKRLAEDFPGNPRTGILAEDAQSQLDFENFANDEPCPALDPSTGLCDLYSARPMTCRVFGPPVRTEGGLGVCELCFTEAGDEEIARCEMIPDPDRLEEHLTETLQRQTGAKGQTIVAYALLK